MAILIMFMQCFQVVNTTTKVIIHKKCYAANRYLQEDGWKKGSRLLLCAGDEAQHKENGEIGLSMIDLPFGRVLTTKNIRHCLMAK
jgi:hypothetical protein